jgi:hypothetical protein
MYMTGVPSPGPANPSVHLPSCLFMCSGPALMNRLRPPPSSSTRWFTAVIIKDPARPPLQRQPAARRTTPRSPPPSLRTCSSSYDGSWARPRIDGLQLQQEHTSHGGLGTGRKSRTLRPDTSHGVRSKAMLIVDFSLSFNLSDLPMNK